MTARPAPVELIGSVRALRGRAAADFERRLPPAAVLVCPPDHFDVVDVKNPFMKGNAGRVDKALARRQWEDLCAAFQETGLAVETIPAVPGLEDMTFTANQTLVGPGPDGRPLCLLSRMRHPSRRREVPHFERWFRARGIRTARLPAGVFFEGPGDALWHPGRRLLWGGWGFRSSRPAYRHVARRFGVPVVLLKLVDPRFYHLDTCLCLLGEETALYYPGAFDAEGRALIQALLPRAVAVTEAEALKMALNGVAARGTVILQRGLRLTERRLKALGFRVRPVDTSEFIKSGGSAFCLKQFLA